MVPWICEYRSQGSAWVTPFLKFPLSSDTWFKALWRLLSRGLSTCNSPHASVSQAEKGKRRGWISWVRIHNRKPGKETWKSKGKALEESRAVWAVWIDKAEDMEDGAGGRRCVGVKHCSKKVEHSLVLKVTENPPTHWFCELLVVCRLCSVSVSNLHSFFLSHHLVRGHHWAHAQVPPYSGIPQTPCRAHPWFHQQAPMCRCLQ